MKNADMPAMPVTDECGMPFNSIPEGLCTTGLTKREMMAMHIAEGFVSSPMGKFPDQTSMKRMCEDSVALADLLLTELDRTSK